MNFTDNEISPETPAPVSLADYGITGGATVSDPTFFNWGPVGDNDTIKIEFPNSGDPPQWVKVKRYITEEDDGFASDEAMRDGMKLGNRQSRRDRSKRVGKQGSGTGYTEDEIRSYFKSGVYRITLLQRLIREWSFTTPDGRPIPVLPEAIAKLPTATRDYIMEHIEELNPRPNEDEEDEEGNPQTPLA